MPRDRAHSRERSPAPHATSKDSKKYRDRTDPPTKRKTREASEDATLPAKKKIQLAAQPRKENNYPSVNELKRRVRDVSRLLKRVDLPADVRVVQERALAGYEKDLEDETQRRDRSQMIKKYHFVRFLDRKSANKDLNRLLRREKDTTDATDIDTKTKQKTLKSLRAKIHAARVNLNYTIYYPLNDKYVSLYAEQKQKKQPGSGTDNQTDDDDADLGAGEKPTVTQTPAMWYTIEKCMEEGTLDLLRENKLNSTGGKQEESSATEKKKTNNTTTKTTGKETKKSTEKKSKRSDDDNRKGKNAKHGATREDVPMRDDANDPDGDESDGGFFEK